MFNKNKKKNKEKDEPRKIVTKPVDQGEMTKVEELEVEETKEPSLLETLRKEEMTYIENIKQQAKLICVGKVRNVFNLEQNARKLIEVENKIIELTKSNS